VTARKLGKKKGNNQNKNKIILITIIIIIKITIIITMAVQIKQNKSQLGFTTLRHKYFISNTIFK
jgi:hypothetical protein